MELLKGAAWPRGTDSAKVIQVIETAALRGSGADDDPVRVVKQFWSFAGELIAEVDPFIDEECEKLFPQAFHMQGNAR